MKTPDANKTKEQEPEVLDVATLAAVDKVQPSFDAGEGLTIQETRELNRKRYRMWLDLSPR